ncbi:MAG: hypothetical protein U0324_18770 [Polyangiales bacterium]
MNAFDVLEARADGCDVEVYLNGIPVTLRGPTHGRAFGAPVNHLVVDGVNELALVVDPGPRPSEALSPAAGRHRLPTDDHRAWARLARYPAGAVIGGPDGVELLRVEHASSAQSRPVMAPRVVEGRVDLGARSGRWAWQDAPRLSLDATTRNEIAAYLTELAGALSAGDCEVFLARSELRLAEVAQAFGRARGEKESVIRDGQARRRQRPGFAVRAVDVSAFDLRLCAGGRLVECVADDWRAIVREAPSDETMYFPMMLARLGGAWCIAR